MEFAKKKLDILFVGGTTTLTYSIKEIVKDTRLRLKKAFKLSLGKILAILDYRKCVIGFFGVRIIFSMGLFGHRPSADLR